MLIHLPLFSFLRLTQKELRKHKQYPYSLDELKEQLQTIDFQHSSEMFNQLKTLRAADEKLFQIPYARFAKDNPQYQLVDSRGRGDDSVRRAAQDLPAWREAF